MTRPIFTRLFENVAPLFVILSVAACAQPPLSAARPAPTAVTFNRDIAPIIHANCSECHNPHGPAPFALLSYEDVHKRARQIAIVTQSRFMPPWLPARGRDLPNILGERGLSDAQVTLIQNWVAQGAQQGDPVHAHGVPELPPAESWRLGEPDLVVTMDEPYIIPAEGVDVMRTFVLPTRADRDHYIKAIEFRPLHPRAVHHASFLVDTTGNARLLDESDPQPGYAAMGNVGLNLVGSFGGWSPAARPHLLPKNIARLLPADSDLVVQVHFKPTGKPEHERFTVGLHFANADDPIDHPLLALTLGSGVVDIAPGEATYRISDSLTLMSDVHLIGIAPQAHYLCKTMEVIATHPDGTRRALLSIPDWDFNWQQEYQFAEPIILPAGTRIEMTYVYDNSETNPRNPHHPPRRVRGGHKLDEELALLFLHVAPVDAGQLDALQHDERQRINDRGERERAWRLQLKMTQQEE